MTFDTWVKLCRVKLPAGVGFCVEQTTPVGTRHYKSRSRGESFVLVQIDPLATTIAVVAQVRSTRRGWSATLRGLLEAAHYLESLSQE